MAKREQVNCEICKSFLHTTEQHKREEEKANIEAAKQMEWENSLEYHLLMKGR